MGLLHCARFVDPVQEEALVGLEIGCVDKEVPQLLDVLNAECDKLPSLIAFLLALADQELKQVKDALKRVGV